MNRAWLVTVVAVLYSWPAECSAQDVQRIPAYRTLVKVLREQDISVQVAGRIKGVIPNEEGVFVKKGELLVELNDEKIQAEVTRADREAARMTEINFAQVSLEAAEEDQNAKVEANQESKGAYSPSEMRQVKLEVDKANASLEKAKEDQELAKLEANVKHVEMLEYKVHAPHDGCITDIKMFPGQSARPGDAVMTLTDLSVLEAEVYIPFQYRDALHIGDEVEIRPGQVRQAAEVPGQVQQASARQTGDEPPLFQAAEPADEESLFQKPSLDEPRSVVPAVGASSDEVFVGKIKFIKPRVIVENKQSYVVLSVHVPNPRDNEGRYRLQEGMPVDAVVLSTPRTKTTSIKQ